MSGHSVGGWEETVTQQVRGQLRLFPTATGPAVTYPVYLFRKFDRSRDVPTTAVVGAATRSHQQPPDANAQSRQADQ